MKMQKILPSDFSFFPKTWVLPGDMHDFKNQFNGNKKKPKTFIIKPTNMCQGKGIYLVRKLDDIDLRQGEFAVA